MTPAEFQSRMASIASLGDPEAAHGIADDLLCEVLESLGYADGVAIFKAMTRWYA